MGNSQRPFVVCCCYSDCCEFLSTAKQFSKPAELFNTNYYATIDSKLCIQYNTCIVRCKMSVLVITAETQYINRDRCIGCRLCKPTCSG